MTPLRTCAGCGRVAPKRELVRFAERAGTLVLDRSQTAPGRGVYTCPDPACFDRAQARRGFVRTLRRPVTVPAGLRDSLDEG